MFKKIVYCNNRFLDKIVYSDKRQVVEETRIYNRKGGFAFGIRNHSMATLLSRTYAKSTKMLRNLDRGNLAMFQLIECQRTQFLSLVIF